MTQPKPVALVTGAGRGIGRGIAIELARSGFNVAANDIVYEPELRTSGLMEVKLRVEECGTEFLPLPGDISSIPDHEILVERTLQKFGRIDCLVNNAGVAQEKRLDILETTPAGYDRLMSINARGPFFLTQKVARWMIKEPERAKAASTAGGGRVPPCIVFITSISASVSSTSRAEYCVSKAALSQTARVFADRLAGSGVNVYELRPGIVKTDMTSPVKDKYDKLIAEGLVPQGRWGLPEDVGKAVAALALGCFAFSTGSVIEISGGMDIRRL